MNGSDAGYSSSSGTAPDDIAKSSDNNNSTQSGADTGNHGTSAGPSNDMDKNADINNSPQAPGMTGSDAGSTSSNSTSPGDMANSSDNYKSTQSSADTGNTGASSGQSNDMHKTADINNSTQAPEMNGSDAGYSSSNSTTPGDMANSSDNYKSTQSSVDTGNTGTSSGQSNDTDKNADITNSTQVPGMPGSIVANLSSNGTTPGYMGVTTLPSWNPYTMALQQRFPACNQFWNPFAACNQFWNPFAAFNPFSNQFMGYYSNYQMNSSSPFNTHPLAIASPAVITTITPTSPAITTKQVSVSLQNNNNAVGSNIAPDATANTGTFANDTTPDNKAKSSDSNNSTQSVGDIGNDGSSSGPSNTDKTVNINNSTQAPGMNGSDSRNASPNGNIYAPMEYGATPGNSSPPDMTAQNYNNPNPAVNTIRLSKYPHRILPSNDKENKPESPVEPSKRTSSLLNMVTGKRNVGNAYWKSGTITVQLDTLIVFLAAFLMNNYN